ncbi:hypothetical protein GOP47_0019896 [Adiantum capillus-veneris]|uniref:HVA22-like protein n=1 Tax=Adiantum capillus-veneris TaxID=13818 RepID=A0A9D4ZA30_ADICA|nr:hypothetical protein GOP47_0019896 [Adiantum capillus-veneris]
MAAGPARSLGDWLEFTVGVGFPVYSTFKAIEQHEQQEQEQWLMYWGVYGCFHVVEVFSDKLLFWFPHYHLAKLAFLIWLQLPISNGARHCFMRFMRPFCLRHQNRLDSIVDGTRNEINKFVVAHQQEIQFVHNAAHKLITTVQQNIMGNGSSDQPAPDSRPRRALDSAPSDADTFTDDEHEQ